MSVMKATTPRNRWAQREGGFRGPHRRTGQGIASRIFLPRVPVDRIRRRAQQVPREGHTVEQIRVNRSANAVQQVANHRTVTVKMNRASIKLLH